MIDKIIFIQLPVCMMTESEEDQEKLNEDIKLPNENWGSNIVVIKLEICGITSYWPHNGGVTLMTHNGKFRVNMVYDVFDKLLMEKVEEYNKGLK